MKYANCEKKIESYILKKTFLELNIYLRNKISLKF